MTQAIIRFFVMILGNTMDSHKTFLDHLTVSPKLREVQFMKDCDVIIAFVPVVSRAGTDILAAMDKIPQNKPVVLVVLHHTFSSDYIAPDSRLNVNREKVFAVDCLFYEQQGLLRCLCNDEAIRAVRRHLRLEEPMGDDICAVMNRYRKFLYFVLGAVIVILLVIIMASVIKPTPGATFHNPTVPTNNIHATVH